MTESFELPDEMFPSDTAPDFSEFATPADGETRQCAYSGCFNQIPKPARGRFPKFCTEHRPAKVAAGVSRKNSVWAQANQVENSLKQMFTYAGMGIMLLDKVDGTIVAEGGENVAKALTNLGRDDKRVRKYLEALSAPGKYGELTLAVAAIVIPVLAHHKVIPQIVIPNLDIGGD